MTAHIPIITSSVWLVWRSRFLNSAPMPGISFMPGLPSEDWRDSSRIKPAITRLSPAGSSTTVLALRTRKPKISEPTPPVSNEPSVVGSDTSVEIFKGRIGNSLFRRTQRPKSVRLWCAPDRHAQALAALRLMTSNHRRMYWPS